METSLLGQAPADTILVLGKARAKSCPQLIQTQAPGRSGGLFRLASFPKASGACSMGLEELAVAVNFALSAARASAKTASREARAEIRAAASNWRASYREQRENDLKEMGIVIPLSDWLGHNNGPDILESHLFKEWRWRKVQEAALAPPDAETGARWARKAEELGLSYREYRLELLERGRHPTDEDAQRIRAARPRSP